MKEWRVDPPASRARRVAGMLAAATALLLVLHGAGAASDMLADAPLQLDQVLAMAFDRNPDLRAAQERIGAAEARLGEATATFFPQIGARLSYTRTDNPAQAFAMLLAQRRFSFAADFNHPGPTQDVRPEIGGSLSLFRGGQDYERRAAAASAVSSAALERAALRNALADAVIAGYYALLAGPEQVDVARMSIAAVDSALAQTRTRYRAGTALKSDMLSLEARRAAAREAHVRAQNAVELARTALRTLIALPAEAPLQIVADIAAPTSDLPETLGSALAAAAAQRPELGAAAAAVAMREHELRAERAAYLPRIDLVGNYGQDNTSLELTHQRDNWTVGAIAELDLFSGFRTRERVRGAERRLAETRALERHARLEVERDVTSAWLSLQEARERVGVTAAAVTAADEAFRLVEVQYESGTATITRYLEAEVSRAEARSRAVTARYDARRSEAGVRKALGHWAEVTPE